MKLDSRKNLDILRQCIVVKEMNCQKKLNKLKDMQNNFKSNDIRKYKLEKKVQHYSELNDEYSDIKSFIEKNPTKHVLRNIGNILDAGSEPVKRFADSVRTRPRFSIVSSYYKKAGKIAEETGYFDKPENRKYSKEDLKKRFFGENKLTLNKLHSKNLKLTGASVTALLVAGAITIASFDTKKTEIPSETNSYGIEQTYENTTPETKVEEEKLINLEDSIGSDLILDFKQRYADEYNLDNNEYTLYPNNTNSNFKVLGSSQSYVFAVKVGDETRYVSHGDYPDLIQNYLDENGYEYSSISGVKSITSYHTDLSGDITTTRNYDFSPETKDKHIDNLDKIESVVYIPGGYNVDGVFESGGWVKLFDGNAPDTSGLFEENVSPTILEGLAPTFRCITTNPNATEISYYAKALTRYYQDYPDNALDYNILVPESNNSNDMARD